MSVENCLIKDCRASKNCCGHACKTCGWNPEELARRQRYLTYRGLRVCSDGLMRLVMPAVKKGG